MSDRTFRIHRSAEVSAPVDEVRRLLLDPATWSEWQPEIVNARGPAPMGDGDVARGEAKMLGFDVHGHTEVLAGRRDRRREDDHPI
jgi:hypothetical protein